MSNRSRRGPKPQVPDWQIAIVGGEPEVVVNAAAVRALVLYSPLGPIEARRRLVAAGFPADQLDEPDSAA